MKKKIILTIASLCIISDIESKKEKRSRNSKTYKQPASTQQLTPINPYWHEFETEEQEATSLYELQGKTFTNDKPVIIKDLPESQLVMATNVQVSITLECKNGAGKKVRAPQPTIKQVGRYRNYLQIYIYDFSHIKKPLTCSLTIEKTLTGGGYGGGERIEREKTQKGKYRWELVEKGGKKSFSMYTFKVVPAKTTSRKK